MKKNTVLICILAGIVVCAFWFIGSKNNLVTLREDVRLQQAQVETLLQRRNDLIPNLVATVKGYTSHEEEIFTEIAEARAKLAGGIMAGDMESVIEADASLSSALSRLLVIDEKYPDLKADEQFTGLRDEISGSENRISFARQKYNESVTTYNTAIQKFPTSVIANMSGFKEMKYFEADEDAKDVPVVSFE